MPNTCEMLWMIVGMDQRGKCCKKKVHEDEDDEDYDAMTEHEKAMLFPNEADKLPEPDFERFARDVKLRKPKGGKLGIHIIEIGGKVVIDRFTSTAPGVKGAAEASGEVKKGDWIVGVGTVVKDELDPDDDGVIDIMTVGIERGKTKGEVGGENFHEVLHMLKHVPNPVVLRMHAPLKKKQKGPAGDLVKQIRRVVADGADPGEIVAKLTGREKKRLKKERDALEEVLASAKERGQLDHQVSAKAKALQAACSIGNYGIVKTEVNAHYRRINRIDDNHDALLHVCCREGFFKAVDFILNPFNHPPSDEHTVDLDARGGGYRTPLLLCFTPPQMTSMTRFPAIAAKFREGTPLEDLLEAGGQKEREKCIAVLVDNKCDIEALDAQQWTPLMLACLWDWPGAVTTLVNAGARLHSVNYDDEDTAMHVACKYGHVDCVKALLRHKHPSEKRSEFWSEEPLHNGAGETALTLAVQLGRDAERARDQELEQRGTEIVRVLLESGVPPDTANTKGQSPIKLASKNDLKEAADMLLYRGVQAGEHAILRYMKDEEAKRELLQKIASGAYQAERNDAIAKRSQQEREAERDGAQWKRFHDPYHAGATYYYNTMTGKSQWDEPQGWTEPPSLYAHTEKTTIGFRGLHPQLAINAGWLHSTKGRRAPGFATRDAGEMVIGGQEREAEHHRRRVAALEAGGAKTSSMSPAPGRRAGAQRLPPLRIAGHHRPQRSSPSGSARSGSGRNVGTPPGSGRPCGNDIHSGSGMPPQSGRQQRGARLGGGRRPQRHPQVRVPSNPTTAVVVPSSVAENGDDNPLVMV